jgi:hypothetical protein
MKKEFTFYEFVGIISPGIIFLLIVSKIFPEVYDAINLKELSLGGLGIVVIIAYVTGHLIQSIGNLLEKIWWWFFGGMPTNWIIKQDKQTYLSPEQISAFPDKISTILNIQPKNPINNYNPKEWFAVTRQIYAAVDQAKAADRVDTFNGNYGFFRGIASSLRTGILILIIGKGCAQWQFIAIIGFLFILAIARMHRFGKHYARELFVQFLQIKETDEKE